MQGLGRKCGDITRVCRGRPECGGYGARQGAEQRAQISEGRQGSGSRVWFKAKHVGDEG